LPSFEAHVKVAVKDGIDEEIMKEANELVDTFHKRELEFSPSEAESLEAGLAPTIVKAVLTTEDTEPVKAVCHHYTLDFFQRRGYQYILDEARDVGLEGAYDFLETDDEFHFRSMKDEGAYTPEPFLRDAREIIDKWKQVHESDEETIDNSARKFARMIKDKKG